MSNPFEPPDPDLPADDGQQPPPVDSPQPTAADSPVPPPVGGPLPPPPSLPPAAPGGPQQPAKLYNAKQVWITAVSIMVAIAVISWFLPYLGLLVPVIFFVSLFFLIPAEKSVSYRSGLAGVLIGFGLGMIITAGVCTAVFNNSSSSPFGLGL